VTLVDLRKFLPNNPNSKTKQRLPNPLSHSVTPRCTYQMDFYSELNAREKLESKDDPDVQSFRACNGEIIQIDCTRQECNERLIKEFLQALECLSTRNRESLWNDPKCPVRAKQDLDMKAKEDAVRAAKLMLTDGARLSAPLLFAAAVNKGERGDSLKKAHTDLLKALNVKSVSNTLMYRGIVPFLNVPITEKLDACEKGKEEDTQAWMKVAVMQLLMELALDKSNPLVVSGKGNRISIKSADPSAVSLRLTNLLGASGLDITIEQRKKICDSCIVESEKAGKVKQDCVACYALMLATLELDKASPEVVRGENLRKMLLNAGPDAQTSEQLAKNAFQAVQLGDEAYFTKANPRMEDAAEKLWRELKLKLKVDA